MGDIDVWSRYAEVINVLTKSGAQQDSLVLDAGAGSSGIRDFLNCQVIPLDIDSDKIKKLKDGLVGDGTKLLFKIFLSTQ